MTYNAPPMTVTMTMTVTEILATVTIVHHLISNMTMTLTVDVIKKKHHRHNDLAITVNDATP